MPVPAGSYVRRVALTPHYDGVIRSHNEPAVIAICGIGPVNVTLNDPSKPPWREVWQRGGADFGVRCHPTEKSRHSPGTPFRRAEP